MGAKADVRNREEWWRSHGTEEFEAAKQIIDVARAASREARDANVFKRGRLLRNAEQVAGEQSEKLRGAVPSFLSEGTPSFRAVVNHSGRFWFSMYRFNVSNGAPPLVPA